MEPNRIKKLLMTLTCICFIYSSSGCSAIGGGVHVDWGSKSGNRHPYDYKKARKGGPPPHAPAHGYRAKHKYRYYPSSNVYFDASRRVYFYIEGDIWRTSALLPQNIRLGIGDYVNIEMDTDKPYAHHKEHKCKYPPGQLKKKKNKKWG